MPRGHEGRAARRRVVHGPPAYRRRSVTAMTAREQKGAWRRRLLAARRAQPPELRAARGAALAAAVVELARAVGPVGTLVCAYLPVGTEPAWASGLDGLRAAGYDVLLPVVPP